jgi:hypothetical protein
MSFWRRKPITHATALWALVGIAVAVLIACAHYAWQAFRIDANRISVHPPKNMENMNVTQPTLFGTVVAIEGTNLRVASQQPFDVVLTDETTAFSAVAGGAFDRATLRVGAIISATGKDQGDRALLADAVAVIENPDQAEFRPQAAATILDVPSDWKEWGIDSLIGWGASDSDYAFALRGYDRSKPAASVELYDWKGKLVERIELDADELKQLKNGNDFLTPEQAEAKLKTYGITGDIGHSLSASSSPAERRFVSPDQKWSLSITKSEGDTPKYEVVLKATE